MAISSTRIAEEQEQRAIASIPKVLSPGNHVARVYNLELIPGYKHEENNSLHLIIHLEETPRGEGFEGFFIDKDDESKGRFKGQIGRVKASQFAFESKSIVIKKGARAGETMEIDRDNDIAGVLSNIAKAQGKIGEYNIDAETIEEFVEASKAVLCNNVMLNWCLGGSQYMKDGYEKWDLNLTKDKNNKKFPFSRNPDNVIKFNAAEHTKLAKAVATVDEFGGQTEDSFANTGDDFNV